MQSRRKNVILQWLSKKKNVALRKYNLLLNIKTPPSEAFYFSKVSNLLLYSNAPFKIHQIPELLFVSSYRLHPEGLSLPVAIDSSIARSIKSPFSHTNVILPVAFFVKFPLLLATNIDIFLPLFEFDTSLKLLLKVPQPLPEPQNTSN
jgi:hypothetical protein